MPNNEYTKNLIALNQRILEIAAEGESVKVFFTTPEARMSEKEGFYLEGLLQKLETSKQKIGLPSLHLMASLP